MSHMIEASDIAEMRRFLKEAVIYLARVESGAERKYLVYTYTGYYEVRITERNKRQGLVNRTAYKGKSLRLAIKAYNAINI